jgi:peptidoglycan-associated lipoprotein
MKRVLLSSAVVATLIFSGCSSKDPAIDATADDTMTYQDSGVDNSTESVAGENVVVDENGVTGADNNEMTMSGLEMQLQSVHFAFDQFALTSETHAKVKSNAELVSGDANNYMVKVEGNCDEWGSDEYNFALGLKRAEAVKKALVAEGIDATRISMVSYGESNPVCTDKTKECWAQNRRVNFKLLP